MTDTQTQAIRNAATEAERRALSSRLRGVVIGWGPVIGLILLWQLLAVSAGAVFFPPPFQIAETLVDSLFSGDAGTAFLNMDMLSEVGASLARILLGFALGSIGGCILGVLIGLSRQTGDYVNPIIDFLRSIPSTATIPLFIILLGGSDWMRVAFIAWSCSWFVVINTAAGVRSIEPGMLEMARLFRVPRPRQIVRIVLPAAMPQIFAGLRVALTAAVLFSVVSEFYLAVNGIGFQIVQSQRRFHIEEMWMWMVVLAVVAWGLNAILHEIEGHVLRWHKESKQR